MRDTYYQSSDNPVQVERLPATSPTIQLLPPRAPQMEILATVTLAALAMISTNMVTLALYPPSGISCFEPFDAFLCWMILLCGIAFALWQRRTLPLYHPICLAALLFSCLCRSTPEPLRIGLIAGFAGLLVYLFGQHWTVIATASPMPRQKAAIVRLRSHRQLVLLSLAQGLLLAALLATQLTILWLATLALSVAAIAMPAPQQLLRNRYQLLWEATSSWMTFEPRRLPGLLQSPVGSKHLRLGLLVIACTLGTIAAVSLNRTVFASAPQVTTDAFLSQQPALLQSGAYLVGTPVLVTVVILMSTVMPVVLDAGAERDAEGVAEALPRQFDIDLRTSPDRIERNSLLHGRVVVDGSPALIPRDVHFDHVHVLGDGGAGTTSLFLCPTVEQLVHFGDSSVIALDLDSVTLELLASLQAAAEVVSTNTGRRMKLRHFSAQRTLSTFAFNPLKQSFWRNLDHLTQADILCAATGLADGIDHGAGFHSSSKAAILFQTLRTYPHLTTFAELAERIAAVITASKKQELHPEIRRAGVHIHEVIKRLAACEALNVTENSGHQQSVVEQAIDLTDLFREPQLVYCHLPTSVSLNNSTEIANLFMHLLLAASTQIERRCRVFLIINQFHLMVANNLEYLLQRARDVGIGVIIANQAMQDLRKGNVNLIPTIEAHCRLRQWFSVSSVEDQDRLVRSSGLTVETITSTSESVNHEGKRSTNVTYTDHIAPRLTINDILLMNDHPLRSILRVSRGEGYAQFGGMPVIIESQFHISKTEYERRKALPWPEAIGAFIPGRLPPQTATKARLEVTQPTFQWSEEVINSGEHARQTPASDKDLNTLFDNLRDQLEVPAPRRRKRSKS